MGFMVLLCWGVSQSQEILQGREYVRLIRRTVERSAY